MLVYLRILIDLPKDSNDTFVSLSSPDGDVTLQTNSESSVPASIGNVDTYKILHTIILYDRIVIFEGSIFVYFGPISDIPSFQSCMEGPHFLKTL